MIIISYRLGSPFPSVVIEQIPLGALTPPAVPTTIDDEPAFAALESVTPEATLLATLNAIYTEHAPEKLAKVPSLLAKYAGREEMLMTKVRAKYNIPIAQSSWSLAAKHAVVESPQAPFRVTSAVEVASTDTASSDPVQPSSSLSLRDQIISLYTTHGLTEKVSNVDRILDQFAGREAVLVAKMEEKYNIKFALPDDDVVSTSSTATATAPGTAPAAAAAAAPTALPLSPLDRMITLEAHFRRFLHYASHTPAGSYENIDAIPTVKAYIYLCYRI